MRLISCHTDTGETLGVEVGQRWMTVQELVPGGPVTMSDLLGEDASILRRLENAATPDRFLAEGRPTDGVRLMPPVPRPGKVVAIGRNYRAHAEEEGVDPPTAPLIFAKWPSSVIGPDDLIRWEPALTSQVDYEAELAVVIGRIARRVSVDEALECVLGYTCLNDVSARDLQFGDGQWVRGKSLDSFCPVGPAIVTADEVGDPQSLSIACFVNGERVQDGHTSQMYFGVAEIISHCSQAFTLEPGDVIATGTPSGVGVFRDPPRFLEDGDVVVVEIERIGRLENRCALERVGAAA